MKKSGVLLIIIMVLSLSSFSVSATNHVIPCQSDADCPSPKTCEYYAEYGNVCGGGDCNSDSVDNCGGCSFGDVPSCIGTGNVACELREPGFSESCFEVTPCCLPIEPINIFDAFIGFDIAENLLKNKLLFTLHIIKESIFQTELKIIETSLTQHSCTDQPLSFRISKRDYRYGKIEEIDALVVKLLLIVGDEPFKFGLSTEDVSLAQSLVDEAENLIDQDEFFDAFHCKYWAYQSLIGKTVTPDAEDCFCMEEDCGGTESCSCPEGDSCPCETCSCEFGDIDFGEECAE